MEQDIRKAADTKTVQNTAAVLSVRCTMDGPIEIWKGGNVMRLSEDEATIFAKQLYAITEV